MMCIHQRSRNAQCAADQEVGKLADAHRDRAAEQQVQQYFDCLNGSGSSRSHRKASDQDCNLREVKLIEARCNRQREFNEHQDIRNC